MIVVVTFRPAGSLTGVGDKTVRIKCRSWHINERTGAIMIHGEDNGAAMAFNRGYWLTIDEEGSGVEVLPPKPNYPRENPT